MDWTEAFIIAGEICDYLASQGHPMPDMAQHERIATLIHQRKGMKWSEHNQTWYTPRPPIRPRPNVTNLLGEDLVGEDWDDG